MKDDLNRRVDENAALPDLVTSAINMLGIDWLNTKKEWACEQTNPSSFYCVINRKETAVAYH